jgi:hypothetical protein
LEVHHRAVGGFRFQVSGFRYQVSGFRSQVSGFRFQGSVSPSERLLRAGYNTAWRGSLLGVFVLCTAQFSSITNTNTLVKHGKFN